MPLVVEETSIRSEILPNVIMIQNKEKVYALPSTRLTSTVHAGISKHWSDWLKNYKTVQPKIANERRKTVQML